MESSPPATPSYDVQVAAFHEIAHWASAEELELLIDGDPTDLDDPDPNCRPSFKNPCATVLLAESIARLRDMGFMDGDSMESQRDLEAEAMFALEPSHAFLYAKYVLYSRFLPGEAAISKEPEIALLYAEKIIGGPFPAAEPFLAEESFEDALYPYIYASSVIKGRFPIGEDAIATDAECSYLYANNVLHGPFALGEGVLSTNLEYGILYARYILKGRFPDLEPLLAFDSHAALEYAISVCHGRFKVGERAITLSQAHLENYAQFLLFGKNYPKDNTRVDPVLALCCLIEGIEVKGVDLVRTAKMLPHTALGYSLWISSERDEITESVIARDVTCAYLYSTQTERFLFCEDLLFCDMPDLGWSYYSIFREELFESEVGYLASLQESEVDSEGYQIAPGPYSPQAVMEMEMDRFLVGLRRA